MVRLLPEATQIHQRNLLRFDTHYQISLFYCDPDCSLATLKIQGEIVVLNQYAGLLSSLEAITQLEQVLLKTKYLLEKRMWLHRLSVWRGWWVTWRYATLLSEACLQVPACFAY